MYLYNMDNNFYHGNHTKFEKKRKECGMILHNIWWVTDEDQFEKLLLTLTTDRPRWIFCGSSFESCIV